MLKAPIERRGADPTRLQRAVPRQPVEWKAKYRFHDGPAEQWRECRVADISTAGSGLKLFGVTPEEVEGREIEVLVHLSGEVRNTVAGMKKEVRAGVEFLNLSGEAATFVDSLRRSHLRW